MAVTIATPETTTRFTRSPGSPSTIATPPDGGFTVEDLTIQDDLTVTDDFVVGVTGSTGATATVISKNASALAVGRQGATAPALKVDSSATSSATGIGIVAAAAGSGAALVVISSGTNEALAIDAKGTGTVGIGGTSTGAVTITPATTVTGALTPTGGIAAAGGFSVVPSNWHTGGMTAQVNTDGTDATPSVTETYVAAVHVPANATITGISIFNGSATGSGNVTAFLANSTGTVVANTASTAISGTDAFQRVAFTGTYAAKGPATYYVATQYNNTSSRFNTHTFGDFRAGKITGTVYGTLVSFTPPTSFTTALGPIASLY